MIEAVNLQYKKLLETKKNKKKKIFFPNGIKSQFIVKFKLQYLIYCFYEARNILFNLKSNLVKYVAYAYLFFK